MKSNDYYIKLNIDPLKLENIDEKSKIHNFEKKTEEERIVISPFNYIGKEAR
ncbi:hypothetical protein RH915_11210 [Serpentinicella sp. ANB-PHB4]|uniref:hypothetical protein n=1 Tax=Serpentinicella sp. ANB-PHB4 TaxID=3074076 RepID=UPI0028664C00|nr:hypothetical protein [Serpentinicella sp. ANB-PHB4]MDR5660059.1 hypothetical protein [Serpentinicella sp. ANB-PHB4]